MTGQRQKCTVRLGMAKLIQKKCSSPAPCRLIESILPAPVVRQGGKLGCFCHSFRPQFDLMPSVSNCISALVRRKCHEGTCCLVQHLLALTVQIYSFNSGVWKPGILYTLSEGLKKQYFIKCSPVFSDPWRIEPLRPWGMTCRQIHSPDCPVANYKVLVKHLRAWMSWLECFASVQ